MAEAGWLGQRAAAQVTEEAVGQSPCARCRAAWRADRALQNKAEQAGLPLGLWRARRCVDRHGDGGGQARGQLGLQVGCGAFPAKMIALIGTHLYLGDAFETPTHR